MRKNCLEAIMDKAPDAYQKLLNASFQQVQDFINQFNTKIKGGDITLPG